jgi:multidrug resistance efflux pump
VFVGRRGNSQQVTIIDEQHQTCQSGNAKVERRKNEASSVIGGKKMTTKFTGKEADFRRRQNGSRRGVYSRDTLLSGRFERKNIKFKR